MKKFILCIAFFGLIATPSIAQMSGVYSVPGTHTSVAQVVNNLNSFGINGPTTINIASGYVEKAPFGGYALTATGTNTNPLIFQKSGVGINPVLYAYSGGTSTASSGFQDGIFRLVGSDYVTIDGIDIIDTNSVNPATMEYGFGLYKASVTNGCRYNMIKNCTITLNRRNDVGSAGNFAVGSRGINVANLNPTFSFTISTSITSTLGTNSFNKFYANTIQNCHVGIAIVGYNDSSPYTLLDTDNDIGGMTAVTGNTIVNFGGFTGSFNPAYGILTKFQTNLSVSNNLVNNNNGSGSNHPYDQYGIKAQIYGIPNLSINNNTITLKGGAATPTLYPVQVSYYLPSLASTGTVDVIGNLITNCTHSTATSGSFYGIDIGSEQNVLNVNNNVFLNNSVASTGGAFYGINCIPLTYSIMNVNTNIISGVSLTAASSSMVFRGIYCDASGTLSTLSISNNTLQSVSTTSGGINQFGFIYNSDLGNSPATTLIDSNKLSNFSVATNTLLGIYNACASPNATVSNNSITTFTKTNAGGNIYGYVDINSAYTGSVTINNNIFSNPTFTGNAFCSGIELYNNTGTRYFSVSNNTISSISTGTAASVYGMDMQIGQGKIDGNTISNITAGNVRGIYFVSAKNTNIYDNTINSLIGRGIIRGMDFLNCRNNRVFRNKIYDLELTGNNILFGIATSQQNDTLRIYNNLIGDLRAPNTDYSPTAITAINLGNYGSGTFGYEVHHNTIFINASSSGTNFGTRGLYYNGNWANLTLNNNIIINTSIPNGTCQTICYELGGVSSLSSYSTSSNNNLFYAGGGPWSAYKEILLPFGVYSSLAAVMATISPRESNSKVEFPPFISTVGANPNYLNLSTTIPTQAESGGTPITWITTDFAGNLRNASTPDIGAWEDNYTLPTNIFDAGIIDNDLKLYPNPNNGIFILEINSASKIIVTNLLGEEILKQEAVDGKNKIDIQNQASGIYFVKIINSESKESITEKIIKQ